MAPVVVNRPLSTRKVTPSCSKILSEAFLSSIAGPPAQMADRMFKNFVGSLFVIQSQAQTRAGAAALHDHADGGGDVVFCQIFLDVFNGGLGYFQHVFSFLV
jgi:hypothetical protein